MEKKKAIMILEAIGIEFDILSRKYTDEIVGEKEKKAISEYIEAIQTVSSILKEETKEAPKSKDDPISDYEHMLMSALRYALGRRTYIVSLTTEYITKEIPNLSNKCRYVMMTDIKKADNYGDECDRREWEKLYKELLASLELDKRLKDVKIKEVFALKSNMLPTLYFESIEEAEIVKRRCLEKFSDDFLCIDVCSVCGLSSEVDEDLYKTKRILEILERK